MQNAIHLPLTAIVIKDRVRSSTDDIDKLKASITRWGLLQPLLLDQDNVLQDGWRRYTALNELGVHEVAVYYRNRLTEAEYYEVELELSAVCIPPARVRLCVKVMIGPSQ